MAGRREGVDRNEKKGMTGRRRGTRGYLDLEGGRAAERAIGDAATGMEACNRAEDAAAAVTRVRATPHAAEQRRLLPRSRG